MTAAPTTFAPHPVSGEYMTPPPRPQRQRHRILGLSATQIVVWQLAIAAVACAAVARGWVLYAAGALAAVAVLCTIVRYRNRWLCQWLAVWWHYRSRRRTADPNLAPLRQLLPALAVATATGRRGEAIGVVHDGRSWVAMLAVRPDDEVLPGPDVGAGLTLAVLAETLAVDDIRLAAAQVVVHMVPAPGVMSAALPVVAASYSELNGGRAPATHATWIALRLNPADCPDAVDTRGGGVVGVHRAMRRCVARAVELLDIAGLRTTPLDEDQIRVVLAAAAGIKHPAVDGQRVSESWRAIGCGGLTHSTYWLRRWPEDGSLAQLLAAVGTIPALLGTVSLTVAPEGRIRVLVRVAAPSGAGSALEPLLRRQGWRPARLDGEHALGLVATLPLGGSA